MLNGINLREFNSVTLTDLLRDCGVDPAQWRRRKVEDLFAEGRAEESQLVLARRAGVVVMKVLSPDRFQRLVEVGQQMAGESRVDAQNPRPPAGKIALRESPQHALEREMNEELDLNGTDHYVANELTVTLEAEESRSYPGILGVYDVFTFVPVLTETGLTQLARFRQSNGEYAIVDKDKPGRIIFFRWVPA